ncbi:MAG: hypothetical protein AB7D39_04300 [Pseudodesulfovibrio sp.]|uniref:hypothetical protein n=1 Tax=Pseudodesulfovibrio sp. TaxID=2035812 RepID=UPI003D1320D1
MTDFNRMYPSMADTSDTVETSTSHGEESELDAVYSSMDTASAADNGEMYPLMETDDSAEGVQDEFTRAAGGDSVQEAIEKAFEGRGELDQEVLKNTSSQFDRLGINAAQAPELLEMYEQEAARRSKAFWGSDSGTWETTSRERFNDAHVEAARSVVNEFAGPQFKKMMQSHLGNNPSLIGLLGKVGRELAYLRGQDRY